MEEFELLKTIADFLQNNEVEHTEINFEKDNYSKVQIDFDMSNGINVDISGENGNFYLVHNTMTSDEFCKKIKINDKSHLEEILKQIKGGI